jgi:hypothetical protein
MTHGEWSKSGRKLAAGTVKGRADEAASFLAWAAWRDLRPPFKILHMKSNRRVSSGKRSADAVCDAFGSILQTVTPQECANYFKHAGYTKPNFIPL